MNRIKIEKHSGLKENTPTADLRGFMRIPFLPQRTQRNAGNAEERENAESAEEYHPACGERREDFP